MSEKAPQKPQSNQEIVEQSASKRAAYTRRYIESIDSVNMQSFVESLSKAPFNIKNVDPRDVENDLKLTQLVYQLQQKLQLPNEINRQGCDGMFGPYTFKRYTIAIESHKRRSALRSSIKPPTKTGTPTNTATTSNDAVGTRHALSNDEQKEKLPDQPHLLMAKNNLSRQYKYSETFAVGDSLMLHTSRHLAKRQGKTDSRWFIENKFAKGARRTVQYTDSVRKHWKSNEEKAMKALDRPDCQLLVLNGGYNDLTSAVRGVCKSSPKRQEAVLNKIIERIVESHKRIIAKAHSMKPKKEVVLFTLNHRKPGQYFKGWMKNPIAQKLIKRGIDSINKKIYSESDADMIIETNKLPALAFGKHDKLHWTPKGARMIIDSIAEGARLA